MDAFVPAHLPAPFLAVEDDDKTVFSSITEALQDLERWEVDSGAVRLYDGLGRELRMASLTALRLEPWTKHRWSQICVIGVAKQSTTEAGPTER